MYHPPTLEIQRRLKSRRKGENNMSQPFEMDGQSFFGLAGEACGLLVLGFSFLVLAFCV